jgi:NADP-dependent 3-hydroxy acid dehydrogenase YdfG
LKFFFTERPWELRPGPREVQVAALTGELAALTARRDAIAMPPEAVAETIAFAVAQPASVDIGEILVRPTVQP